MVASNNASLPANFEYKLMRKRVIINREGNEGLGIIVSGGTDKQYIRGNSSCFVSSIREKSPAFDVLNVGDLIYTINGNSLKKLSHAESLRLFVNLKPGTVTLEISEHAADIIKNHPNHLNPASPTNLSAQSFRRKRHSTTSSESMAALIVNSASDSFNSKCYSSSILPDEEEVYEGMTSYGEKNEVTYTPYSRHRFISSSSSIYGKGPIKYPTGTEYFEDDEDDLMERASTVSHAPSIRSDYPVDEMMVMETPRRRIYSCGDMAEEEAVFYSECVLLTVGVTTAALAGYVAYRYFSK
uniref:PDZ domain-containing protein n=1 Tax=Rhabditophanes sp. KR3021 TaxID=114890 RepID=A0AC35U9P0_9BILA